MQVMGKGAIHAAAEKGLASALKKLLRLRPALATAAAGAAQQLRRPLHYAALGSGTLECAQALLDSVADVHATDSLEGGSTEAATQLCT